MSQTFLRWLGAIALAAFIAQNGPLAAVAQSSYPVATNLQGSVAIVALDGTTHNVTTTRIVHSGETVMTGVGSMAVVDLADIGRILLGPATRATTYSDGSHLSMQLATGALCVNSQQPKVNVQAGPLAVKPSGSNTIFDLKRSSSRTELAVYQGSVTQSSSPSQQSSSLNKGSAAVMSPTAGLQPADMRAVNADFSDLGCPEAAVVAQALPQESAGAGGGGGGSAGGILAALLGIGAIVAAVSHGGGSKSSSNTAPGGPPSPAPPTRSPTPAPTPSPTTAPTPSPSVAPTPSILPSILPSASVAPASPSPSPSASALPSAGLSSMLSRSISPRLSVQPALLETEVGEAATVTVSETNYTGLFHADVVAGNVSLGSQSARGPLATFTVIARGRGAAAIAITDDRGHSQIVRVFVVRT